ncbi:MAG: ankyrin repeat domain-containing protein [Candidatus Thiodiazotropha taylori]
MAIPKPKQRERKGINVPPEVPNIFVAAENDDVKALDRALEYYDVNERDESGMTPLHYAASTLSRRTIKRLLDHPKIDATLADKFGRSAATVAFESWRELSDDIVNELNPHCYPWLYENSGNSPE